MDLDGSLSEEIEDLEQLDADFLDGDEPADALIEDWTDDFCTAWALEKPDFPRYQIHVELLRGDAIP